MPVAIGTLGHLGFPAEGVVDVRPVSFGDGLNGPDHGFVLGDSDGVADTVVTTGRHDVLGVEPRVGPQGELTSCPRSPRTPDRLPHAPSGAPATTGRALPVADVEDLPGACPGGDERVLAEHSGVAIGSTLFLLPID